MERFYNSGCEFRFSTNAGDRAFEGYAAVFGNVDSYGDVIAPGAFAKSLSQHQNAGSRPPMLLEHGYSSDTTLPVGVWTHLSEDGTGLYAKGELLDTAAGRDTYVALKAQALSGLSIGFRATDFALRGADPTAPRRTIKAADLVEISVVAFPANDKARVAGVKSVPGTIREFEEFLRDAGFSRAHAAAVASRGFKSFDAARDAGLDAAAVDALASLTQTLKGISK